MLNASFQPIDAGQMTFTLYAATVPAFMQFLNAQISLVDKAEAFCFQQQISP